MPAKAKATELAPEAPALKVGIRAVSAQRLASSPFPGAMIAGAAGDALDILGIARGDIVVLACEGGRLDELVAALAGIDLVE